MTTRWDAAVIGAGAAGLAAARGIAAAGLRCVCLERINPGGLVMNLGRLHGHPEEKTGPDLGAALIEAATEAGAAFAWGEARALLDGGECWRIETDGGDTHAAGAVILASGLTPGSLGIDGEDAFEGRGLSHCAACDGPLCEGQPVLVAGADAWAAQEAADLLAWTRQVTLLTPPEARPEVPAGVAHRNGHVVELEGDDGLRAVVVEHGGGRERLAVRTLFVLAGRCAALGFAPAGLACDAHGLILVDDALRTNLRDVYAAGDVRSGAPNRAGAAIEDGERAARALVARHAERGAGGRTGHADR